MERGFAATGFCPQPSATGGHLFGIPDGRGVAHNRCRMNKLGIANRRGDHALEIPALTHGGGVKPTTIVLKETFLREEEDRSTAPITPSNDFPSRENAVETVEGGSTTLREAQAGMETQSGNVFGQDVEARGGRGASTSRLSDTDASLVNNLPSLGIGAASLWKAGMVRPTMTMEQLCAAVGRDLSMESSQDAVQQRVAYQGIPGAYSEGAALRACPGCEPLPCEQFELAFQALSQWLAERAVLPIQNSLGGSIHEVYDLLNRYRLHIVGEVLVPISHCLMAVPGVVKEDVTRVMSHPQALAQCDTYLRNMGVVRESVSDTAGAARTISQHGARDVAAVASERAAELYGLEILERGIQDERDNVTRFIVLSRDPLDLSRDDKRPFKTSIAFTLGDGPGQLYKVLSIFAMKNIDLTMIESRPNRSSPVSNNNGSGRRFKYTFYIDLVGSTADLAVKQALRHLEEVCPWSRVLGSYPVQVAAPTSAPSSSAPSEGEAEALETPLEAEILGFGPRVAATPGGPPSSAALPLYPGLRQILDQGDKAAIAYQGAPGAYSEGAALQACPDGEPLPCEQFETAVLALAERVAERAVMPIENSLGGSIHAVYDLLLRYRVHIVGETTIGVRHCLLALPGVRKDALRRIISHPQALAQVDNYIRRLPRVVKEAVDDTAGAAKMIAEGGWTDVAAVASERAGLLYGLDILDSGIQDNNDNFTRFLVLSREPLITSPADTRPFKTSIVISMPEGTGQLFNVLSVFALRDIDLTKIESRPLRSQPVGTASESQGGRRFLHLFYLDFEGNLANEKPQNALRHLQEIAPFMRVLGCYPMEES